MEETSDIWVSGFVMFSTPRKELMKFATSNGTLIIETDRIVVKDYLFNPAVTMLTVKGIRDINLSSFPPTIRVGDELIFVPAPQKGALAVFANTHQIPIVKREDIWGLILEPFLDTDYTKDNDEKLAVWLEKLGLSREAVFSLRQEVKMQMLKYNFDTMLWEWTFLGLADVLKAMWAKYDNEQFADFYKRAMAIALL